MTPNKEFECEDCGSREPPYHNEGCMMGDIGWERVREKEGVCIKVSDEFYEDYLKQKEKVKQE